jgi:hypothetical protein
MDNFWAIKSLFKLSDRILTGVAMFAVLSVVAPSLPYGYLLEILFAAVLAVSLVLAIKYPSFGKRWVFLLFVVGIAEYWFSRNPPSPYNTLVVGTIIGAATIFSGLIVPVLYLAKLRLRSKQVKTSFVLSGCLELVLGMAAFFYFSHFYAGLDAATIWFIVSGLFTIGLYSLVVGVASFFFGKSKRNRTIFNQT